MHKEVVEAFKRFCERLRGFVEVNEVLDSVTCYLNPHNYLEPAEHAHEFAKFLRRWEPEIREDPFELKLESMNMITDGYVEHVGIKYDPEEDEFRIYAKMYSEFGERYGNRRRGVAKPSDTEEIEGLGIWLVSYGGVEWNEGIEEWRGYGEAWTTIKDLEKLPEGNVKEVMETLINKAHSMAKEAQKKLIEVPKEIKRLREIPPWKRP